MKKQAKNRIFKSVLLLLSVAALLASIAVITFAAEPGEEQTSPLVLVFEAGTLKCYIETRQDASSPWETYIETQTGGTFQVPYGEHIRLRAVANTGEWAEFAVESETVYNIVDNTVDNTVEWTPYKKEATVTITCVNRTYTILPLNYDQGNGMGYATLPSVGWSMMDWKSGAVTITYQYGAEPLTQLPPVKMEDHNFNGWNIVMGDGSVTPADVVIVDNEKQYFIPKDLSRTSYFNKGIIYVYPEMEPLTYPVYRQDVVYDTRYPNNRGEPLFGATAHTAIVNTSIYANALDFWWDDVNGFKQYTGYQLMTDLNHRLDVKDPPADNLSINTVYRYYAPIVYTLRYNLNDNGDATTEFNTDKPESYTYANTTHIGRPTRVGYTFQGWTVEIYTTDRGWVTVEGGLPVDSTNSNRYVLGDKKATYNATTRNDPNAIYASDAQEGGIYEIRLIAQWTANEYDIGYDWGDGVSADLIQNKAELPTKFTFNEICSIPNPVRSGYTFAGWTLTYEDGTIPPVDGLTKFEGGYTLDGSLHAQKVKLIAAWEVKSYDVKLEAEGATNAFTKTISGVIYDAALVIPDGFVIPTKTGYTFAGYYTKDGKMYIDANGVSQCAAWDIDGEDGTVTLVAKWEINSYNITINPIQKVPAGVEITIETKDGQKYPYTGEPISLPYQTEFTVHILMPNDYKIVVWNGTEVEVHNGNLFVSPSIILGAEDITLSAEARPAAPNVGVGYDIDVNIISEREIQVNFTTAEIAKLYEVAISQNSDGSNLTWMQVANGETYYSFTELNPGTTYFVFIRLRETEISLSGIPTVKDKTTRYIAYVKEIETVLKEMVSSTDGDCVKALVEQTIQEIYDLIPEDGSLPPNFYTLVEEKVAAIEEKLAFARLQDSKIAALQKHLEDCMASGSFNLNNKVLLNSLCAAAVADISVATTVEGIETIYEDAMAAMKAVLVTYLYDDSGAIKLESLLGLSQSAGITLNSVEDIQALRRAISDAIAQGKITADSFITIEQATELLRALDTVSAYNFYLINVQPAEGDTFIFRMLIPETLAGRTGLQVAYYDAATGMVELLETTVEGNMLVFRAKQVADFVILADPTVDLTGVIIALGVIVLCQLIAIILVLAARSKAKNAIKHASVALPMFLTIYFQPANSEMIALGLGALVLILQIVLMWLLISSGMIRVFKTKKPAPTRQKPAPAPRQQTAQPQSAAAPVESTQAPTGSLIVEEEDSEEGPEYEQPLDTDAFDETLADELAHEQTVNEFPAEAEEVYDDEEFIEHAPNPYYSLDDEENEYAYNQEETERVSDVDTTDPEAEETSYGADPIDGVFGETYVPNGYSGDERGGPRYEDSYGESYEYGDEADAPYAAPEDVDREETSDEGSVDPAAYVVNDNEEYSEEEEMYRYDE